MTISRVAELIATRCPGWVVDSIDFLGEGDFCDAYLVNGGWIFRFAKHAEAAASLLRESCLLPRIANQFDVRIPSPQLVNVDRAPAFMAYPLLSGQALTPARYLRLIESDRERCASQLARFVVQMHATDIALARQCGVKVNDYRAHYGGLLARAREHLFVMLAQPERSFVEQAIAAYLETQDRSGYSPVVLHGDLSPDHVFYDASAAAVTGIIDFGDMAVGDPAWDLVYIYEDYGLDFLGRFLSGYVPAVPDSLLERVYRFYVLDAIEWVVRCAEHALAELDDAIAQLGHLRARGEQQFQELLSACSAA